MASSEGRPCVGNRGAQLLKEGARAEWRDKPRNLAHGEAPVIVGRTLVDPNGQNMHARCWGRRTV